MKKRDTRKAKRTNVYHIKGSNAKKAKRTNVCHLRSRDAGKARRTECPSLSKEGSDAEEAKRAEYPSHEGVVTPGRLGGLMSVT